MKLLSIVIISLGGLRVSPHLCWVDIMVINTGLNKLVKKLDKRLSKRKTPTKKLKVLPEYSKFPQPSNAPAWAIKQDATR